MEQLKKNKCLKVYGIGETVIPLEAQKLIKIKLSKKMKT